MFLSLAEPEVVKLDAIIFEEDEEDDDLDFGYGSKT